MNDAHWHGPFAARLAMVQMFVKCSSSARQEIGVVPELAPPDFALSFLNVI